MNVLPENIIKFINLLERLPGLGPKSSARIAMHILKSSKEFNTSLSEVIGNLNDTVKRCKRCSNLSSNEFCTICSDRSRDQTKICIVEDALDVYTFENSIEYNGLYHVLEGIISPVNGIGPEDLTINKLLARIKNENIKELIIATNPTIEGEATAMYIKDEV